MMKTYLLILSVTLIASISQATSWHKVTMDTRTRQTLDLSQLMERLGGADLVVLGEKHYTPEVQIAEGRLIRMIPWKDLFLGWEFLNASAQSRIDILWQDVVSGKISAVDFLAMTQGTPKAGVYAPVLEALKFRRAWIYGLNLSREEKAPVTQGGLKNADPKIIPPGFEMGSPGYFERFKEVMGEHVPTEKMQNYYEAQCLTDDVMAYSFLKIQGGQKGVVIAGSFHTDFFDGTVLRLRARSPKTNILTIKIVDTSDYSESELMDTLSDPKYGAIADLVYFVNEPK